MSGSTNSGRFTVPVNETSSTGSFTVPIDSITDSRGRPIQAYGPVPPPHLQANRTSQSQSQSQNQNAQPQQNGHPQARQGETLEAVYNMKGIARVTSSGMSLEDLIRDAVWTIDDESQAEQLRGCLAEDEARRAGRADA